MLIRRALIVDVETTGHDPAPDSLNEIGAVLYSVEYQTTLEDAAALPFKVLQIGDPQ